MIPRRTPLHTRTPLGRGKPLERRKPLTVKTAPKGKHRAGRKPPRDTGPDPKTRALVLVRDGYQCVRCGKPCGPDIAPYSLQHRVARGAGGTSDPRANSPERLLLMCGTATTGCHGEVEKRGHHDNAHGYWLNSWQNPATEGVIYVSEHGSGIVMWLHADGSLSPDGPECAA